MSGMTRRQALHLLGLGGLAMMGCSTEEPDGNPPFRKATSARAARRSGFVRPPPRRRTRSVAAKHRRPHDGETARSITASVTSACRRRSAARATPMSTASRGEAQYLQRTIGGEVEVRPLPRRDAQDRGHLPRVGRLPSAVQQRPDERLHPGPLQRHAPRQQGELREQVRRSAIRWPTTSARTRRSSTSSSTATPSAIAGSRP